MAQTNYTISSSAIVRLDYDEDSQTMWITFKDGRGYGVPGVPEIEVSRLADSDSPGSYWNLNMKGKY